MAAALAATQVAPWEELFVTGLPMDCSSEQAKTIFSQYGSVKSTNVLPVSPGKTAAACFVLMETVEDAKWIVEHVNGNVPQNLTDPVNVVFATPKSDRSGGKGMGMGMKGGWKGGEMDMMNMMWMMKGFFNKGYGKGGGGPDPSVTKYKTVLCTFFESQGFCQRGDACTFAHGPGELGKGKGPGKGAGAGKGGMMALGMGSAPNPAKYKTVMCNFFLQGLCTKGETCTFAHGAHEIKGPGAPA